MKQLKHLKYIKLIVFILLIGLIILLNHIYGWSDLFLQTDGLSGFLAEKTDSFLSLTLLYIVLTIVGCVVLAVPGMTFAILAGAIFGPYWGSLFCLIATTIGAALSYLVGKFFLKDSIKPLVMKNKYLRRWLFEETQKSDMLILFITRTIPVFPYNLQNFAYGITNINFWRYTLFTFLFMIPGVIMFTFASSAVFSADARTVNIIVAIIMLLFMIIIGIILYKKHFATPVKEENKNNGNLLQSRRSRKVR